MNFTKLVQRDHRLEVRFSRLTFLFVIIVFCDSGFTQDSADIMKLFPESIENTDWKITGNPEVYDGDHLFEFIDGGADIFFEYGFGKAVKCDYSGNSDGVIRCEIYRMTDDSAAFGIYSINASVQGKPIIIGTEALRYERYIEMWKGRHFIRIIASDSVPSNTDILEIIAKKISDRISDKGKEPGLMQALNLGVSGVRQVKYFRGQIALNNIYNFGMGSLSGFTEGISGTLNDIRLFIFTYKDDHKCREWFASAKGKMQMNRKYTNFTMTESGFTVLSKTGDYFSFLPYKRFILVVSGASMADFESVTGQIQSNLDGF